MSISCMVVKKALVAIPAFAMVWQSALLLSVKLVIAHAAN